MARKVIDGLLYDTEEAEEIASRSHGHAGDFEHFSEALYVTDSGRYFIYGKGGARSPYRQRLGQGEYGGGSGFRTLSEDEAQQWAEKHAKASTVMEYFGDAVEMA